MGMFDDLVCEYPLPKGFEEFRGKRFQTKDLDNALLTFVITEEGKLLRHSVRYEDHPTIRQWDHLLEWWKPAQVPVEEVRAEVPFHGDVEFIGSRYVGRRREKMGAGWASVPLRERVTFRARFTNGSLARIDVLEDQRGKYDGVERDDEWEVSDDL